MELYVIAGPNGAGKTTFAREFLPIYADCRNFVNADLIAEGVSPFSPEAAAFRAGRMMLDEIRTFAARRLSFGFETTLSGRTYVRILQELRADGYEVHFFFLWLKSPELAMSRVRERVARGGHDVPGAVIRRRFGRSIRNFFVHYRQLADSWILFDNSTEAPSMVALEKSGALRIINKSVYGELFKRYGKR